MAAGSGGPVGILDVTDGGDCVENGGTDCYQEGDPVPDQTGANGINRVIAKPVLDPAVAQTAKSILTTVVTSGTGERAQTGEPTWGKTGTTDDNGDAWFCGGTEDITACVWVGHPNSVEPMETEFAGGPVDGGTYPAEIWHDVVLAYDSIVGDDGENSDDADTSTTDAGTTETYGAPVTPTTTTPAAPAAPAPAPAAPTPAPQDAGPAAPPAGGETTDGGTGATGAG
jgi:penicillin-binding protein 1A